MRQPFINVTIPVYNEEKVLAENVAKVAVFLETKCPYACEITIANNASTDRTLEIARSLEVRLKGVRVLHLSERGRGRAVKTAWRDSQAGILSYMDVDLSTDLIAFLPLVEALATGGFDLAVGSRVLEKSETTRSIKREFISRCYNLLIKRMFRSRFSDAQCGFKAITRETAAVVLPLVEDNGWFMDTELLVTAEDLGYSIFDLPVRWVEDSDTRVQLLSTALQDLRGLLRLYRRRGRAGSGPKRKV